MYGLDIPNFDVLSNNFGTSGSALDPTVSLRNPSLFQSLGPGGTPANGQAQGASISGSVAGLLGLPVGPAAGALNGAAPGAPGQPQPTGNAGAASPQGAQPQNLGTAVGSGLRSLFDGIVYGPQGGGM